MGAGERVEEAGEELKRESRPQGRGRVHLSTRGVPVSGRVRTLPGVQELHPGGKGSRSPQCAPRRGEEGDHNVMDASAIP